MRIYSVEETAVIDAPPDKVYAIISDYHEGHQAILPRRYFKAMTVLAGGKGSGTKIKVEMDVFGVEAVYDMLVSEPEPGRILQEEDAKAGVKTTFTVDSINQGTQSRVTISTRGKTNPGIKGWMEKMMNPPIMRRIYREELNQLATVSKK